MIFEFHKVYNVTREVLAGGNYDPLVYEAFYLYRDNKDTWFYRVAQNSQGGYIIERDKIHVRTRGEFDYYLREVDDLSSWDEIEVKTIEGVNSIIFDNV